MRALLRFPLLLLVLLAPASAPAEEPSFRLLEESLTCQCGCGLTVHSCNHLQCPSAIPLRREIRQKIADGLSHDAILAFFAGKYGEKILSAPTTSGFNLAAWVVPFLVVGVGAALLVVTLRRWRTRGAAAPGDQETGSAPPALDPEEERRVRDELERMDS